MRVQLEQNRFVEVSTLSEAVGAVVNFIHINHLSLFTFRGGDIYDEGEVIAHVSFNGQLWDLDQKEIKL